MADVQPCARRVREHVQDIELRYGFGRDVGMTLGEWVGRRDFLTRVPRPERLLAIPMRLPFGLNQMKRILTASCHKPANIGENRPGNNAIIGIAMARALFTVANQAG